MNSITVKTTAAQRETRHALYVLSTTIQKRAYFGGAPHPETKRALEDQGYVVEQVNEKRWSVCKP